MATIKSPMEGSVSISLWDIESDRSLTLLVESDTTPDDVRDLIESSMGCSCVGVLDQTSGITYPMAVLAVNPWMFANKKLVLVTSSGESRSEEGDEEEEEEDGSGEDDNDEQDQYNQANDDQYVDQSEESEENDAYDLGDDNDDDDQGDEDDQDIQDSSDQGAGQDDLTDDSLTLPLAEAIEEAKHLVGLPSLDVNQMLRICHATIGARPRLSRADFLECFEALSLSGADAEVAASWESAHIVRRAQFINLLFDSFRDKDSHLVSIRELASLLTMLSSGHMFDNHLALFQLSDYDDCGFVSSYALLTHLDSVFAYLFNLSAAARRLLQAGHLTTRKFAMNVWQSTMACFPSSHCSQEGEDMMSCDEFTAACEYVVRTGYGGLIDACSAGGEGLTRFLKLQEEEEAAEAAASLQDQQDDTQSDDDDDHYYEANASKAASPQHQQAGADDSSLGLFVDDADFEQYLKSLIHRRRILGLNEFPCSYVLSLLADKAVRSGGGRGEGRVSLVAYHRCMSQLIERHFNTLSARERSACDSIICGIYVLFDPSESGSCPVVDLGAGLSVYCGGSCRDKARALYNLAQRFGDAASAASSPSTSGVPSSPAASSTTSPRVFAPSPSTIRSPVRSYNPSIAFASLTRILGVVFKVAMMMDGTSVPTDELDSTYTTLARDIAMEAFAESDVDFNRVNMSEDCMIPQQGFENCVSSTFSLYFGDEDEEPPTRLNSSHVGSARLGVSVGDSDAAVNVEDLLSGLSVGASVARAKSASISPEKAASGEASMEVLLSTSSRDSSNRSPARSQGSPARSPFKLVEDRLIVDDESSDAGSRDDGDDDGDGGVYGGANGERDSESQSSGGDHRQRAASSSVVSELREVGSCLGLSSFPADDLIESLGDYALRGHLTRTAFSQAMQLISRLSGNSDDDVDRAMELSYLIFDEFAQSDETDDKSTGSEDDLDEHDDDNDDGGLPSSGGRRRHKSVADHAELAAGLSCLCGSVYQDKLLVAFTVMDADDDGLLTVSQMTRLVLSALRVVVVCSPTAADKVNRCQTSLEGLASAVVREASLSLSRMLLNETNQFSLEMVSRVAVDCMALADEVAGQA